MSITINCTNFVYLRWTVSEILDREIWKIVYKITASGRTEVASDVKFGVGASFNELHLWPKFGDPSSNGLQTLTVSRRRRRRRRRRRWRSTRPMPETPSPTPLGSGVKKERTIRRKRVPFFSLISLFCLNKNKKHSWLMMWTDRVLLICFALQIRDDEITKIFDWRCRRSIRYFNLLWCVYRVG